MTKASGWHRSQRTTSPEWRKTRDLVRKRDRGCCLRCEVLHGRITPGRDVDHAIPQARGGDETPFNGMLLCSDCHKDKTQRESNGHAWFTEEICVKTGWSLEEPDYLKIIRERQKDWFARIEV